MEQIYCQSCGMPITEEFLSKNADGSENNTYCKYCYNDGAFTSDVTMDEMIENCLNYLDEFNKDSNKKLTKDEARAQMKEYFPKLQRWNK